MIGHFEYLAPATIEEAVEMLGRDGARPMAGGTDLLLYLRDGLIAPSYLVDLNCLGLSYVRETSGWVRIGATTTFGEIIGSEIAQRKLSALVEGAAHVGVVQTKNMATVGGNLCSAVPSADSVPPLLALGAQLQVANPDGGRVVPAEEFFTGPKQTVLGPHEILVEIRIPAPPARTGSNFQKVGRRKALTLAVVNAAASVSLAADGATVEQVRIALGAVAPTPLRARAAEAVLQGQAISEDLIKEAAGVASKEIRPIDDLRAPAQYRRDVSQVLVKRALQEAWQRARQGAQDGGSGA
jgi:carbon-monoxide dehydrogenase medium subunit